MEFRILGPLGVWRDGQEIRLGAAMERKLLAVMLLHADEAMSKERLVDALWGENPPKQAVKGIQVRVSALRRTLGPGVIETQPLGYIVRLDKHTLDLTRFKELVAEGQRLLAEGAPHEAGRVLREALALWHGEPLADFRYDAFAANAIGQLVEQRLMALELRIQADLAVGRDADSVPELESLVREHPLRESLRELLMRALYRSGRQAEALAVMQDTRATLLDELGLDPGQSLQQLEKLILNQDPSLDDTAASAPARPVVPPPAEPAADPAPPPLAEISARAQRKVVTVLFADVTDSTLLGESFDPEVVRAMLAEYFERMRAAAERHGGVVEKFIGDAVMAVFGVPAVHEDDALRALRAALEMREAIVELGMEGRIGLESGECVVGTGERLVTGRAVTTAARLEQAAQPGDIFVGQGTMQLARDCVVAEELEPLVLKGKPEPVPAWRLVSVSPGVPARHFDSPFVGRARELASLTETWERVLAEERCELVCLVGDAGLGKSRLVAELESRVDATVAHGRCLSYGAGITYWPVLEVLNQLQPHLDEADETIAAPLRALLEGAGGSTTDELAWAFRKFVESVARERPLLLVFDDIHWAEEALLDLIEHVAFVSSGAPILLLCMARPELLDRRPGWRGLLRLEPLTTEQTEELIHARLGDEPDAGVADRIVEAADGNPLFVEEMAAMLHASDAKVRVPPTIHALLEARLDQLDADERTVLEAAAVEGEVFHRGALEALTADGQRLTARLTALVRKEFIRPDRPALEGDDGFRFRHLLLRDATYDAIPKAARCGLHERYADWLEQRTTELEAFVGYHLEQAYGYHVELRDTGDASDVLAQRASVHLETAATAALRRADFAAAVNLLERASALPPVPDLRRAQLMTELGATAMEAQCLDEVDAVLEQAASFASDDECVQARLLVEHQFLEVYRAKPGATTGVSAIVRRVVPTLERIGDERGLRRAWELQASSDFYLGRVGQAREAWQRAADHARLAGLEHDRAAMMCWLAASTWTGAMPVDEGIRCCDEILVEVSGHPACEAEVLRPLGGLNGFAGRFDVARSFFATRKERLDDLGRGLNYTPSNTEAFVEMLAGNFAAAEVWLRNGYVALEAKGENAVRSTTAALLGRALFGQGRHDEAEHFTRESERLGEPDDLLTQIVWRSVRARLAAVRGSFGDAERLAREAVELARQTDFINFHADALTDLAAVLESADRGAETSPLIEEAIRLYEEKGNTVSADAARARLDALAAV